MGFHMEFVPDQQIDEPDDPLAAGLDSSERMYDSWANGDYSNLPPSQRPQWVRELDAVERGLNGLFGPRTEGEM